MRASFINRNAPMDLRAEESRGIENDIDSSRFRICARARM